MSERKSIKANEFWKLRLKHGRDRKIATPRELLENFEEYAQWCADNPLYAKDWKGKDAQEVDVPKAVILTKGGFALACGYSRWESIVELREVSKDFSETVAYIEACITQQKTILSAADLVNSNFVMREMGWKDQQDQAVSVTHSLATDAVAELAKLLNKNT